jgi:hypothetical protein
MKRVASWIMQEVAMFVQGDTESVNLGTGERQRRLAGNGESPLESFGITGLTAVNPADLAEYEEAMSKALPQIVKMVQTRQCLAAKARQRILL